MIKKKKIHVFSFVFICFFLFSIYNIIPSLNFLLFGKPIFLTYGTEKYYVDPNYIYLAKYMCYSTVGTIFFGLFSKKPKSSIIGFDISFKLSFLLFITGILILAIQFYLTGAYQFISVNHGLIREKLFSQPPFYSYFIIIGSYFSAKRISQKKVAKLYWVVFAIMFFSYVFFWVKIGIRGTGLYTLFIGCIGFFRLNQVKVNTKFFKKKYIFYLLIILVGVTYMSLRTRVYDKTTGKLKENPTFGDVVELLKKRPDFLNPGTLEYGASYKNFAIMTHNNFQQDYPFQIYLQSLSYLGKPILKYIIDYDQSIFYRYRDEFFKERKKKMGSSGGTGFSLQYEFAMQGAVIMCFLYLFFVVFINKVSSLSSNKGGHWEFYLILIFPTLITLSRSSLPVNYFVTKLAYSYFFYIVFRLIGVKNNYEKLYK
ncbi:hypothetical protein [Hyunsoonleella sp. 2307UL5-6]|uniref:hypothetical protein n=1 Tax=Hyunsoonleella sp. 2307UL5-6 TaxID=3384768 RepID=UPI0039BD1D4D